MESWDVFLSHASEDKVRARELKNALEVEGISVWFDSDQIKVGNSIPMEIEYGIENSKAVVICISSSFLESQWTRLERAAFAYDDPSNCKQTIIPVRLDSSPIPRTLKHLRYLDLRNQSPIDVTPIVDALSKQKSGTNHRASSSGKTPIGQSVSTSVNKESKSKIPKRFYLFGSIISLIILLLLSLIFDNLLFQQKSDEHKTGTDSEITSSKAADKQTANQEGWAKVSWGPERKVYDNDHRPNKPTLNSVFNNPRHGDERNFVQIKKIAKGEVYKENLTVSPGEVFQVYSYYHDSGVGDGGKSENLRMGVRLPTDYSNSIAVTSVISADNSEPREVWDSAVVRLPQENQRAFFKVVPNSAIQVTVNGERRIDSTSLTSAEGASLECGNESEGLEKYSNCIGYVLFEVEVVQPNFKIEVEGRRKGSEAEFAKILDVTPGDIVEVKAQFINSGNTQINNVMLAVPRLPFGLSLVPNSTFLANASTEGRLEKINDISEKGVNIGSYTSKSNAYIKFLVLISHPPKGDVPNDIRLGNFIEAHTQHGMKSSNLEFSVS